MRPTTCALVMPRKERPFFDCKEIRLQSIHIEGRSRWFQNLNGADQTRQVAPGGNGSLTFVREWSRDLQRPLNTVQLIQMFERSNVLQAFHGRSCATGKPRPASQQGRSITWLPREIRRVERMSRGDRVTSPMQCRCVICSLVGSIKGRKTIDSPLSNV
jgi:hypothetical protein